MKIFALLLCIPLFGLDGSKTIKNRTTSELTNYPFTIPFWVAPGEIQTFPRPYLTPSSTSVRSAATAWQADVQQRWRDSSSVRTITGVKTGDVVWSKSNNTVISVVVATGGSATVTLNDPVWATQLRKGDALTISGETVDLDLNRTHYVIMDDPVTTTYTVFHVNAQATTARTYNGAGLTIKWIIDDQASGQCRLKSNNHELEVGDTVTIDGVGGITGVNGTRIVSAVSQNEFIVNSACSGEYISGGTVSGPSSGSVRYALVSFVGTVPASGNLKVDVVNSADACHIGDIVSCRAARTTANAMVNDVSWGLQFEASTYVYTGSTATKTVNAKTLLNAWNGTESYCGIRYWLQGPVATQWIIEGCNGANDFGWKPIFSASSAPTTGNSINAVMAADATSFVSAVTPSFEVGSILYFAGSTVNSRTFELMLVTGIDANTISVTRGYLSSTAQSHASGKKFGVLQWENSTDPAWDKAIHPTFVVTHYPGWSGVKVETQWKNGYWDRMAAIWYAPKIKTGAGLVERWSKGVTLHPHKSLGRKVFWDGTDPEYYCEGGAGTDPDNCATTGGGSRAMKYYIDHNKDYLEYSGALPVRTATPNSSIVLDQWNNGHSFPSGYRPGWNGAGTFGDKGDWGVQKLVQATTLGPASPLLYPGEANVNNETIASSNAARDWQSDNSNSADNWKSAEGWWPMMTDALFLGSGFAYDGYEMLFGVKVPGGGGNAMGEAHLPYFWRENADRPLVAGWPDSARDRLVSLHARPAMSTSPGNMYVSSVPSGNDIQGISCYPTHLFAPNSAWLSSTVTYWPCWNGVYINYEPGHLPDYMFIPWLITGDYFWQDALVSKVTYASSLGYVIPNNPGYALGRSAGTRRFGADSNSHIRVTTWPELALVHALQSTPTEPMFGESYNPVRKLLNSYSWDVALKYEGMLYKTDGWASILFPVKFTSSCTGYSASLNSATASDTWRHGYCALSGPNALHYYWAALAPVPVQENDEGSHPEMDWTKAAGLDSMWQAGYLALVMARSYETGNPQFKYARHALGKWAQNAVLNRNTNPYLASQYRTVTKLVSQPEGANLRPQTWAAFLDAWDPPTKNKSSWPSAAPIGYGNKFWVTLALTYGVPGDAVTPGCTPADRPPVGCTMEAAINFMRQTLPDRDPTKSASEGEAGYYDQPRWAPQEPRPFITKLRKSIIGMTANLSWVAPDGEVCKVYLGATPPPTLSDANDSNATAVGRMQSFSGSAAAGYTYRITCGKARTTGVL